MSNEASTPETVTPAPTKAEALAAAQKAKRDKKAADLAARKAANAEKRANGVIGTLHQMLQLEAGAAKKEVLAALTAKFPERDPIGMATTVGIQLSRLQKKHGKIVSRKQGERGLVYGYEATVRYSAEGSEGAPGTVAAADLMKQAGAVAGLPVETGTTPVNAPEQAAPAVAKAQGGKKGSKKR